MLVYELVKINIKDVGLGAGEFLISILSDYFIEASIRRINRQFIKYSNCGELLSVLYPCNTSIFSTEN